jgi:type I restriction enzyme, S subunit
VTRLKDVAVVVAGQSPPSDEVFELGEGLPFLQGNAEFGARAPTPVYECNSAPKQCLSGDVLLSVRAPVGAVNIADTTYGIGRGLCAVRGQRIDRGYLWWWLQHCKSELDSLSTGTTFAAVSAAIIGGLRLPDLSETEQHHVAEWLDHTIDKIDVLIRNQEQLIEKLRERAQAVITQAVWKGLDSAPTSQTRIDTAPQAPTQWTRARNKQLLFESTEVSLTGDEEMLSVSHLTGITPRSEKSITMFEAESTVGYRLVWPDDLVINTMWAWMGALGVSHHEGIVSPAYGVYRFRDRARLEPRYFDYLYRTPEYVVEMTRHSRGIWSSRLRLYPDVFLRLPVVVPPIEEQSRIVDYLDEQTSKISTLIERAEQFIDLAKERRAVLITAAVTGRIDVPDHFGHEGVA